MTSTTGLLVGRWLSSSLPQAASTRAAVTAVATRPARRAVERVLVMRKPLWSE
ncbi:hypothetical protein ACIBU0_32995 [Streptomyces sp. NPDC049627]|uniref:hypothetical protein n=1 Tax=Streptomyces sp. NPDC049627 TaxID=3365595 RepID=UPI0037B918AE